MARNAEKAMSILSRWVDMKKNENKFRPERPSSPSKCNSVDVLEKFRRDLIHEITKKVSQIQNAGLGEFRLRDLNDEINLLIKQKRKHENRIKELGGPDYTKIGQDLDDNGDEIVGSGGYKYFGATKDLPGVKELFENQHITSNQTERKSKYELTKCVDVDYYGYRTTNDLKINLVDEAEFERSEREIALKNWENCVKDPIFTELYTKKSKYKQFSDLVEFDVDNPTTHSLNQQSTSQVHNTDSIIENVESEKDDHEALVERKKAELLAKYTSEELVNQENESKKLLNLK